MPLDIQLEPYVLESVLARDSYLTHYQATGAGRAQYIATEFYPTYMADRTPDGSLKISERFFKEFEAELESFCQRGNSLAELQGAILPIEGVVLRNNTAYVVRRMCSFTTVENYMNGQRMHYEEAFQFIRPLLISLAAAQANGVIFNFSSRDLRVTPQRQLMLDATFSWDLSFHPSLIEIVKLYFKLITGVAFSKEMPSPKDHGVELPYRLEEILNEVLSGSDILYGSLDDFHKKIKFVLDLESGSSSAEGASKTARTLSSLATVLGILVILAFIGMVYGGILAFRASNRWANPDQFADASFRQATLDFTSVTLTHPRDTSDAISGSFHFHDIFLFYRSDWGRPVLARRRIEERHLQIPGVVTTEEETIFVDNVRPSFITTWINEHREGFIFFTNVYSDNAIYRATLEGTDRRLTQISSHTSLHLAVLGDYLYYANYDHNNYLYGINLNTLEIQIVLAMPVYSTATDGERLYLLSGEPGGPFDVYAMHPQSPTAVDRLAGNAGMILLYEDGALFFTDASGFIRSITTGGEPLEAWEGINVHTFTLDGNWLVFTEPGRLQPRAIHRRLGDAITLDTSHWLAYIWARNGVLYGIDHISKTRTHMLQLP
jgi:hypothetical protein